MDNEDPKKVYSDIIDSPRPQNDKRRHITLYNRAAQFAPFAALSGYEEMIREQSRLAEKEYILSEHEAEILDRNIALIIDALNKGSIPEISVTFFTPDKYKQGGAYSEITAPVKAVDTAFRQLILYGSYDTEDRRTAPFIIDFDRVKEIDIRDL